MKLPRSQEKNLAAPLGAALSCSSGRRRRYLLRLRYVFTMREWFRRQGLVRPRRGRLIGGVCRGLAEKLGTKTWLVRLLAVASIILPGPQFVAYLLLWLLMPPETSAEG